MHVKLTQEADALQRASIRWNMAGSTLYEMLKIAHQVVLFKYLDLPFYGLVGSLFSITFFAIHLANSAFDYTLPPFLDTFTRNKEHFKRLFIPYLGVQIPILILAALGAFLFIQDSIFAVSKHMGILLCTIILLEGLRMCTRAFTHTIGMHKAAILIELYLMIIYMMLVWIPFFIFGVPLSLWLIFGPFALSSAGALIIFSYLMKNYFLTLPTGPFARERNFLKRLVISRLLNFSSKVSQFFTGNFLVPLFAIRFDLAQAGLLRFISYLADALKGIIHSTIGFSGSSIFAALKGALPEKKREAFYFLSEKLNTILYVLFIFFACNVSGLLALSKKFELSQTLLLYALFFLIILLLEHLYSVYEKFYIVEEKAFSLFCIRVLEFLLCFGVIYNNTSFSTYAILFQLIIIRLFCFFLLALNAYFFWKIRPHLKAHYRILLFSAVVSLLFQALNGFELITSYIQYLVA